MREEKTLDIGTQFWPVFSNRSYTGFNPELLTSQVHLRIPWATKQTYCLCKPLDIKLDMCDANSFQIYQHINIVLKWKSQNDILQVIVRKLHFINQNSVNLCEKE